MSLKNTVKANKRISVIIAAAGDSLRFKIGISKQFVLLCNKPLLFYSLEKFLSIKDVFEIIVVTKNLIATEEMIKDMNYKTNVNIKVVLGGDLRQDSVYNGFLKLDKDSDLVLIHDVARPLFDINDVDKCICQALKTGIGVLAVPLVDTVKKGKLEGNDILVEKTIERDNLYLIQTPQVFSYDLLSKIYNGIEKMKNRPLVTDEAQMAEVLGYTVNLVIGKRDNIKITYPEDLEIAEASLGLIKKEALISE